MTVIAHALEMLWQLLLSPFNHGVWLFIFKFIPYVLFSSCRSTSSFF